jgi:hypothetical protein
MNALERVTLGFVVAVLLALPLNPPAARGDDDDWEERWEDYDEELEERREEYEERLEDRREAARDSLEAFWLNQRVSQRELLRSRGPAWYGYYGPYYGDRIGPRSRTYFGPGQYYAPGPVPGYYDVLEPPCCHHDSNGPPGSGWHDHRHGGAVRIGPIRVFWD